MPNPRAAAHDRTVRQFGPRKGPPRRARRGRQTTIIPPAGQRVGRARGHAPGGDRPGAAWAPASAAGRKLSRPARSGAGDSKGRGSGASQAPRSAGRVGRPAAGGPRNAPGQPGPKPDVTAIRDGPGHVSTWAAGQRRLHRHGLSGARGVPTTPPRRLGQGGGRGGACPAARGASAERRGVIGTVADGEAAPDLASQRHPGPQWTSLGAFSVARPSQAARTPRQGSVPSAGPVLGAGRSARPKMNRGA